MSLSKPNTRLAVVRSVVTRCYSAGGSNLQRRQQRQLLTNVIHLDKINHQRRKRSWFLNSTLAPQSSWKHRDFSQSSMMTITSIRCASTSSSSSSAAANEQQQQFEATSSSNTNNNAIPKAKVKSLKMTERFVSSEVKHNPERYESGIKELNKKNKEMLEKLNRPFTEEDLKQMIKDIKENKQDYELTDVRSSKVFKDEDGRLSFFDENGMKQYVVEGTPVNAAVKTIYNRKEFDMPNSIPIRYYWQSSPIRIEFGSAQTILLFFIVFSAVYYWYTYLYLPFKNWRYFESEKVYQWFANVTVGMNRGSFGIDNPWAEMMIHDKQWDQDKALIADYAMQRKLEEARAAAPIEDLGDEDDETEYPHIIPKGPLLALLDSVGKANRYSLPSE